MAAQTIPFPDDRITRKQAAHEIGVAPKTLDTWATTGRYDLKYIKIGNVIWYRKSWCREFLERHTIRGAGDSA